MKIKQILMPTITQKSNVVLKDIRHVRNYFSNISDIVTIGKA